jgi:hypothetical protein
MNTVWTDSTSNLSLFLVHIIPCAFVHLLCTWIVVRLKGLEVTVIS